MEPNYMAYAQYMGARNPMADGLNQIGSTLGDLQKNAMLRENQQRQGTLADLQIQNQRLVLNEAQQKATDKAGLRNTLANLQPTTTTVEMANPQAGQMLPGPRVQPQFDPMTPSAMQAPELSMAPSTTQPATTQQTVTKPADPMAALFDYAIKTGNYDEIKQAVSIDGILRKRQAEAAAYGDQVTADKMNAEIDKMTRLGGMIADLRKADKTGNLVKKYITAHPDLFPGIDVNLMSLSGDDIQIKTIDGVKVLIGPDGKPQIVKDTDAQEALLDKRLAAQADAQDKTIAAADRRTQMQIAAQDRRATQKQNGPGKALPAGQLDSIADMKQVAGVLQEAKDLLTSGQVTTGPVSGRLQSLGATVGLANDNFVNFQQKAQTAQNIMLKLRSGAAVTESEYSRFLKEFPTANDPPATRDRKINNTINYFNNLMEEKMNVFEEGGYKVPRKTAQPKPAAKSAAPKTSGRFTVVEVP